MTVVTVLMLNVLLQKNGMVQLLALTATGADYYGDAAIQWDWDDLTDGTEPEPCDRCNMLGWLLC